MNALELVGITFFIWALVAITVGLAASFIEGWWRK